MYCALLFTEAFGYGGEETTETVFLGSAFPSQNEWAWILAGLGNERVVARHRSKAEEQMEM